MIFLTSNGTEWPVFVLMCHYEPTRSLSPYHV